MLPALLAIGSCLCSAQAQTPGVTNQQPDTPPLTKQEIQAQKQHEADEAFDKSEGARAAADVELHTPLSTNKEYQERVQRIGAQISAVANTTQVTVLWGDKRQNKFDYVYKVLKGDDVNAFSLPGGHIYVYEGLMQLIESDDELAGVLAHETSHAAFRHIAQLVHDQQKSLNIALPVLLAAILASHGAPPAGVLPAVSLGMQAAASGWSVNAEKAADYGGFQYLLHTHYDPSGMLTFMERLAAMEKMGPFISWGIYRDHPPGRERADALQHEMEDAGLKIHRSRVTTSFRITFHATRDGLQELDFGMHPIVNFAGPNAASRADAACAVLNDFFDSTPELYEVTAGAGPTLVSHGKTILTLTKADADAAKLDLDEFREQTLTHVREGLFNLGFRVWASHE